MQNNSHITSGNEKWYHHSRKYFLTELYTHIPYDPAIPLIGIYLRETKVFSH